jgi:parallel beta-helix repeat protein
MLESSSNSSISGNNITANNVCGIGLYSSSNNSISGNNITNNGYGIRLEYFSSSSIFHNNFVNNTNQAYSYNSVNVWDDGYPSGGNYWSDYTGVDMKSGFYQNESGSDGVGDTAYSIGVAYQDNYPLVGIFNAYNVTYYTPPLVSHACNVTVISNSTISDFEAPIWIEHPEVIFLMFNASGAEGSTGFCRVSFPTAMMNGTYHVSLNGTEIPYTLLPCSNSTHSYLYFNYTHSTEEVVIIPEFPSFLILSPLFMIATLLAVIIYKRKTEH